MLIGQNSSWRTLEKCKKPQSCVINVLNSRSSSQTHVKFRNSMALRLHSMFSVCRYHCFEEGRNRSGLGKNICDTSLILEQ